jgi:hypothetical protein
MLSSNHCNFMSRTANYRDLPRIGAERRDGVMELLRASGGSIHVGLVVGGRKAGTELNR